MRDAILTLLRRAAAETREISGEEISRRLNISRAAVAKHVKALRAAGYVISARTNRGYSLLRAPDILNQAEIGACLRADAPWRVETHAELNSTNIRLRALAEMAEPEYRVVIAEKQTGGLGRLGRVWYSPETGGLWMSLLLRPALPTEMAPLFTLTAAVAVAEALSNAGFDVRIKWPNDILAADGRKLCGIRAEMRADIDHVEWLLLGIGVNINNRDFPPELAGRAVSLAELNSGKDLRRAEIAAAILERVEENYARLRREGFGGIREQWLQYAVGLGQEVVVRGLQGEERGMAQGLDENGYLLLKQGDSVKRVLAGDLDVSG